LDSPTNTSREWKSAQEQVRRHREQYTRDTRNKYSEQEYRQHHQHYQTVYNSFMEKETKKELLDFTKMMGVMGIVIIPVMLFHWWASPSKEELRRRVAKEVEKIEKGW